MAKSNCTARKQTRPGTWASSPGWATAGSNLLAHSQHAGLLAHLGRIGARLGTRTFLVGGPVRDLLLGRESPDLDVAVESHARQFCNAVALELGGRSVYHSRFLSGTVSTPAGIRLDVNQTRTETYVRPAVLPTVKPAGIEADLARRDFSINAMALDITPSSFGCLLDPLDGSTDLAQRQIRILHGQSFQDDPTRVFRAIRFAVRLGFNIEAETLQLLRTAVQKKFLARLTPERVLYELRLVCREPLVLPMVESLVYEQVLHSTWGWTAPRQFLPGLGRLVQQGTAPDLLFIYWLSFLPVTRRFPIRREEQEAAAWLNRFEPVRGALVRSHRASTIYRLLKPVPEPALRILAALEPEPSARRIRDYLERLARVKTELTGKELRQMGVEPGPHYRQLLDELLFARLDGRVQTRDDELSLCRRLLAHDHNI
ncbi:MAG: hypothetical protein ABIK86_03340 [candidate division WOR-3 bacterium]